MGSPARAEGVRVLLWNAFHAVGMARTGEALLIAVGAGLVALAAAVESGATLDAFGPWGAAALAALSAGAAWFVEFRPRVERIAHDVDERLRLDGGLVTAFEGEGRGSVLDRLLALEVRRRVRNLEVVRAALPNSMPFLALPFLGGALLAMALDARSTGSDSFDWAAPLVAGVADGVGAARDAALDARRGEVTNAEIDRLLELAREARKLEGDARTRQVDAEQLERALGSIAAEIDAIARDLPRRSEVAKALERAGDVADGVLSGLRPGGEGIDTPDPGGSTNPGVGPVRGVTDPEVIDDGTPVVTPDAPEGPRVEDPVDGSGVGKPGSELANGRADGTMSGHSAPTTASGAAPEAPLAPVEGPAGVAAGRWWPERHAGVVGRWVEARRAAREKAGD